jgi:hypothetical protein
MSLDIHMDEVKPGTIKWQIFDSDQSFGQTGYILSGLIEPDSCGGCEISNVQGNMSNATNELMAITVRDMGFDYLTFKVIKGSNVTHYAEYVKSDDRFDHYIVMLKGQTTDAGR